MSTPVRRNLKTSGAETTTTTGSWITFPYAGPISVVVRPTAFSGTSPTFTVRFQGRNNTTNTAADIIGYSGTTLSVGTITGAAPRAVMLPAGFQQIRYRSSFGGTAPSFTYLIECMQQP